jgi:polysaccharide export outer membrane protein
MSSLASCLAAPLLLCSCAAVRGDYVWASDYAASAPGRGGYVIAVGDVINVRVFNQDSVSGRFRVRSDGKISLQFLHDVDAAGYAPTVLASQLETRLKDFINVPVVTVSLEEAAPVRVSVLGEVAHAGSFTLDTGATIVDALAQAGGLNEYAHKDRIFVLRSHPSPARIRFDFARIVRGEPSTVAFQLRAKDAIVVE